MNWTTKPIYQPWYNAPKELKEAATIRISDGSEPIKPTLTINEDGPLGEAGEFTIEQISWSEGTAKNTVGWLTKERNNKVPTHDPYTNPNAHIYYSCDCGNILDPGTKRFAELNNAAMDNGWKIRWGHEYYEPFCPSCVKLKGIE